MGTYCGPYIVYEFEVDGKIYEGRKTIAETCDNLGEYMGDHVKVYYVPNSPDDSTAQISDSAFPKLSLVLIVVGILLMLPGFLQVDQ
jgi:ribonucleotide monophosphatase NagD (HAD superfamily)